MAERRRKTQQPGPDERDAGRVTFVSPKAPGPRTAEDLFMTDSSDGRGGGGSSGGGHSSTGRRDPPPYNRGTVSQKPSSFKRPVPHQRPQRQPPKSPTHPTSGSPVPHVTLASPAPPPAAAAAHAPAPAAAPAAAHAPAPAPAPAATPAPVAGADSYLYTEEYPFTLAQTDVVKEGDLKLLAHNDDLEAQDFPRMTTGDKGSGKLLTERISTKDLEELDLLCAKTHLGAIDGSKMTHKTLHEYIFMEEEGPDHTLELAGIDNAPGLYSEVTQCCRLIFSNKKRLVFTQAKHSAEVGMPMMYCLMSFMPCFHDIWSRRKWSSYYAAINAEEVLQVFVQQTLVTSYKKTKCSFNDILGKVCCSTGGTLYSEKNINGATQTLGDYDPEKCMSEHDYTRYMRHALVIRYLDGASNQVLETVAYAHPETPAANLYEMARLIEHNITTRPIDLLKNQILPTALRPRAFQNAPPEPPLYDQGSYKAVLFILFVIALAFFAVNRTSAVVMIFAVLLSLGGSMAGGNSRRKLTPKTASWLPAMVARVAPKATVIGTSGVSLVIYVWAAYTGYQLRNLQNSYGV